MKTSGLLDQLLKSGQDLLQKKSGSVSRSSPAPGDPLGDLLSGVGGPLGSVLGSGGGRGALATGALGLLLGRKGGRRLGGKAVTYGGLAALGMLAYKAYGNWQAQQATATNPSATQPSPTRAEPKTVDRLPPDQVEEHSRAILKALVAAAKADGHVDEQERRMIEAELAQLTEDAELQRWLEAELNKPLDPVEIAAAATTPELASEMYLASVLMIDEDQFMERAYLDELARQMGLDAGLKAELESQVRGVST